MVLKTALVIDGSSDGAKQALADVERAMATASDEAKSLSVSATTAGQSLTRQTAIAGTTRAGFQQLSYQLGDVAQGFATGVSPMTIFAQQSGQVVQAVQLMGGEAGGFASFLGGPWGIALSVGAVALSPLIAKLFDTKDALVDVGITAEDTMKKLSDLAKKSGEVDGVALNDAKLGVIVQQGKITRIQKNLDNLSPTQRAFGQAGKYQAGLDEAKDDLAGMKGQVAAIEMQIRNREHFDGKGGGSSSTGSGSGGSSPRSSRGGTSAGRTGGVSEAAQAQKALDLENQRYAAAAQRLILERQLAALRGTGLDQDAKRADMMQADAQLESQFPQLAASTNKADQDRLTALKAIAEAAVTEAYARKDAAAAAKEQADLAAVFDKIAADGAAAVKREADEALRREAQQVRTLTGLFEDGFKGGTKAIWKDFENIGAAVLANIAAQFALSLFSGGGAGGGGFSLGSALGSAIGSILPGFGGGRASGGPVSPGQFYAVNERSTAPGLFFPLSAGTIQPPGNDNAGGGQAGVAVVRVELSGDLDARIQQVSGPVALEVVRAAAPAIRDASVAETARLITRPGL